MSSPLSHWLWRRTGVRFSFSIHIFSVGLFYRCQAFTWPGFSFRVYIFTRPILLLPGLHPAQFFQFSDEWVRPCAVALCPLFVVLLIGSNSSLTMTLFHITIYDKSYFILIILIVNIICKTATYEQYNIISN